MTTLDPDHVQVLAAHLHAVDCLPGSMPYARYSQRHRQVHERRAGLVLTGLRDAGYALTTTPEGT